LRSAPDAEETGELTVFGGMKTKQIDVVIVKPDIGPVLAVSVKGSLKAYRNLTNRMEEAVGDSTNIHTMYPGLVYGFLHVVRANRQEDGFDRRDMGIAADGSVSTMIERYAGALAEMTGRTLVRDDPSGYEAVALAVVEDRAGREGRVLPAWPPVESGLSLERFFPALYRAYDLRFPFRGESVAGALRVCWSTDSPLFGDLSRTHGEDWPLAMGFQPRLAG
jgi:hypothetical protein